ncbi:SPFH domain-containing protein [Microcoleus sp. N3A4]|uniref:SPFH domain-containing protein n=1 Tax=Microcoleus sp. N3A4 TaxID=3055379 RepID=UPI002FD372ED
MGLFDKIRGEFVDIIEWLDNTSDTIAYRFERHQNEIKQGAKLTVRPGQIAVFVSEGQVSCCASNLTVNFLQLLWNWPQIPDLDSI